MQQDRGNPISLLDQKQQLNCSHSHPYFNRCIHLIARACTIGPDAFLAVVLAGGQVGRKVPEGRALKAIPQSAEGSQVWWSLERTAEDTERSTGETECKAGKLESPLFDSLGVR